MAKEITVIENIHEQLHPDTVLINHNLALIMIVGEGMLNTVGIAQKATNALFDANVNIIMINQGSSEASMMFGIHEKDLNRAIQSLYDVFFG